jgi:hypothetical protein
VFAERISSSLPEEVCGETTLREFANAQKMLALTFQPQTDKCLKHPSGVYTNIGNVESTFANYIWVHFVMVRSTVRSGDQTRVLLHTRELTPGKMREFISTAFGLEFDPGKNAIRIIPERPAFAGGEFCFEFLAGTPQAIVDGNYVEVCCYDGWNNFTRSHFLPGRTARKCWRQLRATGGSGFRRGQQLSCSSGRDARNRNFWGTGSAFVRPFFALVEYTGRAVNLRELVQGRKHFLELDVEDSFDVFCAKVEARLKYPLGENEEREFKFEHVEKSPMPVMKGVEHEPTVKMVVARHFYRASDDCDSAFAAFKDFVVLHEGDATVPALHVFRRRKAE